MSLLTIIIDERLLAMTPLTTLVDTRVFGMVIPQGEKRASVRAQVIGEDAPQHLRGPNPQTTRIQTDAYVSIEQSADALAEAEAIADAIHGDGLGEGASGLFGFIGDLGGSPPQIRVMNVTRAMRRGPLLEHDGEVVRVRVQQDYMIHWKVLV